MGLEFLAFKIYVVFGIQGVKIKVKDGPLRKAVIKAWAMKEESIKG